MQLAKTLLLLSAVAATGALLLWKLGEDAPPPPALSIGDEPPAGDPVADLPLLDETGDADTGLADDLAAGEDVPEDALDPAATGQPVGPLADPTAGAGAGVLDPAPREPLAQEPIDPTASADAEQAGLAYLDEIRALPEAGPLLDEILASLRSEDGETFGLENLEVDENGNALLDEDYTRAMIKDPEIRAKWDKLSKIIAQAHKDGTLKAR